MNLLTTCKEEVIIYRRSGGKNKNKNNFILLRIFKITNTSCQLFIDEHSNSEAGGINIG